MTAIIAAFGAKALLWVVAIVATMGTACAALFMAKKSGKTEEQNAQTKQELQNVTRADTAGTTVSRLTDDDVAKRLREQYSTRGRGL